MKSRNNKQNVKTRADQKVSSWDALIVNTINQLSTIELLASKLRVSLSYFEKRKASGDKFPGEEKLEEIK